MSGSPSIRSRILWIVIIVVVGIAVIFVARKSEEGDTTIPPPSSVATLLLPAPGMHCESCVETVRSTFSRLKGVESVRVRLESKDVFVRVDTALVSEDSLRHLLVRLGFAPAPTDLP